LARFHDHRRRAADPHRAARPPPFDRARRWGIDDLNRVYTLEEMAKSDCIFAATGVTDGSLLKGVHRKKNCLTTESIVMRASSGTVRRVWAEHHKWDE
jgi:fructose-1,6-bisphosphatase II / sedoheptulose-1,7-bisphosphatase